MSVQNICGDCGYEFNGNRCPNCWAQWLERLADQRRADNAEQQRQLNEREAQR